MYHAPKLVVKLSFRRFGVHALSNAWLCCLGDFELQHYLLTKSHSLKCHCRERQPLNSRCVRLEIANVFRTGTDGDSLGPSTNFLRASRN